jgi:ribonuclease P protein component
MIASIYRFHGHGSLRFVHRHGKNIRGQYFSIKYAPNDRRKVYRLAIVVSKKVSKSAVIRNRIRRRLYEIVRKNQELIKKPYDIAIIVYSDQLIELESSKLEEILLHQLNEAGVILYK